MKKQVIVYEHRDNEINPIRVAIADDHKMLREFLTNSINAIPCFKVILSADNGRHLLQGIESLNQMPEICIIDINMPEMNGYDAQAAIRDNWPHIKSLAISVYDDSHCIARMLHNGANGFVSKQSSPEVLQEALLAVFYEGCYYKQVPEDILAGMTSLPLLTKKEEEYIVLLSNNYSNEYIAQKLGVNIGSLHYYRECIYKKLNVNNKADLILYAKRMGIVFMK